MPPTSQYSATWETLKSRGTVTLAIIPGLHKRIIKAIRKRKDLDSSFRFKAFESKTRYALRYTISDNGRIMKITLSDKKQATPKPIRLKLLDRI